MENGNWNEWYAGNWNASYIDDWIETEACKLTDTCMRNGKEHLHYSNSALKGQTEKEVCINCVI